MNITTTPAARRTLDGIAAELCIAATAVFSAGVGVVFVITKILGA